MDDRSVGLSQPFDHFLGGITGAVETSAQGQPCATGRRANAVIYGKASTLTVCEISPIADTVVGEARNAQRGSVVEQGK
jgi:hypothetical protein